MTEGVSLLSKRLANQQSPQPLGLRDVTEVPQRRRTHTFLEEPARCLCSQASQCCVAYTLCIS